MKLWIKILSVIIIGFVLIFSFTYVFLAFKGKDIMIKQLEELTHRKVSIGYFALILPLNLEIKNLDIQGLAKTEAVSISPSILGLLRGSIALNSIRIIKPEFNFEKVSPQSAESASALSAPGATSSGTTPAAAATTTEPAALQKKSPVYLIIKHIVIEEGKLNFIDRSVGNGGIKLTLKDIYFNLTNLYLVPRSAVVNFELRGKIPWQQGQEEGKIEAEGWLNLYKKDMEATLKIEDIDGIYLYPYYSQYVDLEKARVENAKLNFYSNIHGLNNNVTAECHLELSDIVRKPRPEGEEPDKAEKIATAVLDIFRALNQGKIVLNFTIRTKMDRPEFGFSYIKSAVEDKLAQGIKANRLNAEDVLKFPAKILEGAFKGTTDLSKAVVVGTVTLGTEVGKALIASFKREPKE